MPRNRGPTRIEFVTAPCLTSMTWSSGLCSAVAYIQRPSGLKTAFAGVLAATNRYLLHDAHRREIEQHDLVVALDRRREKLAVGAQIDRTRLAAELRSSALCLRVHVPLDERPIVVAHVKPFAGHRHREPSRPLADLDRRAYLIGFACR